MCGRPGGRDRQDVRRLAGGTLRGLRRRSRAWATSDQGRARAVRSRLHLTRRRRRGAEGSARGNFAIGDDATRPVSLEINIPKGHPRWYPVKVTSTVKRKVVVVALGDEHAGVGNQTNGQHGHELDFRGIRGLKRGEWNGTIKPDEPLSFDVYGDGGTKVFLVVADKHDTIPTEHDVFGLPAANANASARGLEHFTLFTYLRPFRSYQITRESADLAGRLFTTLDPSLIMWVTDDDHCKGNFEVGEPLLILPFGEVLHANGQVGECRSYTDDDLSPTRPTKITIPKVVEPRSDKQEAIWSDEDFLKEATTDKQIASYKAFKARSQACSTAMWSKLDPDGKADMYDVATMKDGVVTKIEGAGDRIFRKVYDGCNLASVEKQRDAIYKRLSKSFTAQEKVRLDSIARRFATE